MSAALPQRIGPYAVLRPLGGGGFSEVFLGEDTRPERGRSRVAIKRVRPDLLDGDPMYRRSIALEGRVTRAMEVPNFARVDALFAVDGAPVMVMEYVEGFGLDRLLQSVAGRGLPAWIVAEIGVQLAEALTALHAASPASRVSGEAGYVHQDLKPSNIRVTPGGVVKVLDLGIAAPIHRPLARIRQGTPGYRSPEQVQGARRLGPTSDLYALGILLFELATGRRLYPEGLCHDAERILVSQRGMVARIQGAREALPVGMVPLLEGLLSFEAEGRLPGAAEARAVLIAWRRELGGEGDFAGWCGETAARLSPSEEAEERRMETVGRRAGEAAREEVAPPPPEVITLAEAPPASRPSIEGPSAEARMALWASAVLLLVFVSGLVLGVNTHPDRFGSLPPLQPEAQGDGAAPVGPAPVVSRALEEAPR